MIYYWLKDKDRRVTLDILDARGRLVRSFSSRQDSLTAADSLKVDALKKSRTDSLKQAGITDSTKVDSILGVLFADTLKDEDKPWPHRPPADPRAPNKLGLNKFAWNMKYPPARSFWGINGVATDGPLALPGRYQVRLTVGGRTATQSFALKLDPRSKVTPADLQAQFAFLKQLRDTVNAVTTAIITIRNVRAQLTDAGGAAAAPAKAFTQKLKAIEDGVIAVPRQADGQAPVYPPGPTERLSSLIFAASTMDARPTAQMYDVFRLFAPQIQKQLVALADALKGDLPAVDAAPKTAGGQAGRGG